MVSSDRRLRILALWGASHFHDLFTETYLKNPKYDFEVVSGDRSSKHSPYAASLGRLLDLRRRLKKGEFDLVLSGPVQNTAWPLSKGLATRSAQALRYFTYKRRMLDTYWAPWLVAGLQDRVPLAVTDTLDPSFVQAKDFPLLEAATLYFKVNLYYWPRRSLAPLETFFSARRVTRYVPKLRPLTFGVPAQSIPAEARPMRERDIDLCFTGSIRPTRAATDIDPVAHLAFNPIRQEIFERCQKLSDRYKVFCVDGRIAPGEYADVLQRSKLVVCTESFGSETGRHYVTSAAGAVPLVNWPYVQNYEQFEPDVHAIYFSLIGDHFERTVAESLASPEKLDRISRATRAFTIEKKEQTKIGEYVIGETLREHARRTRVG
jgi:hypothetical protein